MYWVSSHDEVIQHLMLFHSEFEIAIARCSQQVIDIRHVNFSNVAQNAGKHVLIFDVARSGRLDAGKTPVMITKSLGSSNLGTLCDLTLLTATMTHTQTACVSHFGASVDLADILCGVTSMFAAKALTADIGVAAWILTLWFGSMFDAYIACICLVCAVFDHALGSVLVTFALPCRESRIDTSVEKASGCGVHSAL
ncbi:hypothetical protein AC1031_016982 [Aphanomyces cochlioides]|nr:hypothetical protein AC1031_016982 [Aphanomyces cochlioides]